MPIVSAAWPDPTASARRNTDAVDVAPSRLAMRPSNTCCVGFMMRL